MRPETGPPSPSRRALAMGYVFDDNLFARPPQAEGEISADFKSQIDARRTGCTDKKKAPPVRRGARYRVRSEQRPEPTASSLDESVSKFGPPAADWASVGETTIADFRCQAPFRVKRGGSDCRCHNVLTGATRCLTSRIDYPYGACRCVISDARASTLGREASLYPAPALPFPDRYGD
jgi:hypothetical protein